MDQINSYCIERKIPWYRIADVEDASALMRRACEEIKHLFGLDVSTKILESTTPLVVDAHIEQWNDPSSMFLVFRLHYRLTTVMGMDVVYTPEVPLTFMNHSGKIEWKCPACGIINPIEATLCGEVHRNAVGCGRPREKTRQEM